MSFVVPLVGAVASSLAPSLAAGAAGAIGPTLASGAFLSSGAVGAGLLGTTVAGGVGGVGFFSGLTSVLSPVFDFASKALPLFSALNTAGDQIEAGNEQAQLEQFNADVAQNEKSIVDAQADIEERDERRKAVIIRGQNRAANRGVVGGESDFNTDITNRLTEQIANIRFGAAVEKFNLETDIRRANITGTMLQRQASRKARSTIVGGIGTLLSNNRTITSGREPT